MGRNNDFDLRVRRFNMTTLKEHSIIVILGKRNTGKSTLIKDILYHRQSIPTGVAISGTEEANSFYSNIIPSIQIKHEYSNEVITQVFERQEKVVKKLKSGETTDKNGKVIDPRAFIILDDCIDDNGWTKEKQVRRIFMNGRHYFLLFMVAMQYPLGIPPALRCNVDHVFILRDNSQQNRKRIYENYASAFPNFDFFCQAMDRLTEDFGCMVIDNTSTSNSLYDIVFWYKAEMRNNFKMCAPKLWEIDAMVKTHKKNDKDEQERELAKMRKAPRVYIQKMLAKS
jgi:GTPase SAR1 family protein